MELENQMMERFHPIGHGCKVVLHDTGLSTHHIDICIYISHVYSLNYMQRPQDPCASSQHAKYAVFHGFKSHGSSKYASLKHMQASLVQHVMLAQ